VDQDHIHCLVKSEPRISLLAISAALLELQAKTPSASISKVKGEAWCSSTRLKTSWYSHRAVNKTLDSEEFKSANGWS